MASKAKRSDKPAPQWDPDAFVLPHSLEAERAVLGAALLREASADYIAGALQPEAFFRRAHQELFRAIRLLRDERRDVDLVTVREALGRAGKLEEVGGPAYITALVDGLPQSKRVAEYCAIVRDLAGRRAVAKYASHLLGAVAAGQLAAGDLLLEADRELLELQGGHVPERMQSLQDTLQAVMDDLDRRHNAPGVLTGIPTGFDNIDAITGGWQAGDLVVMGARPSIGKTAFVLNSAAAAARAGRQVAIFSLEMRRRQLEYRLLSHLSQIPLSRILSGFMMSTDFDRVGVSLGAMGALPIAIDDRSSLSAWDVRAACRRQKAETGLDLVIIDYVQLMAGTVERRNATRSEELADISRRMKVLAGELAVPVILLSQLTRESAKEDRPPKLSDLRETGALEQDGDIVCFLHRSDHRADGPTAFIVEKQRNGPTGSAWLSIDRDTQTFSQGERPTAAAPKGKAAAAKQQALPGGDES